LPAAAARAALRSARPAIEARCREASRRTPSARRRDRNPALFGTGKWNRVLIDATMNLDYDPDPELG